MRSSGSFALGILYLVVLCVCMAYTGLVGWLLHGVGGMALGFLLELYILISLNCKYTIYYYKTIHYLG